LSITCIGSAEHRLAEISVRVLPYTTGSLLVQYGKAWRTIAKLSLPNKHRSDSADDAPENPQREDVRRARAGIRRDRPGNRASARVEDRDGDGAAVAAAAAYAAKASRIHVGRVVGPGRTDKFAGIRWEDAVRVGEGSRGGTAPG